MLTVDDNQYARVPIVPLSIENVGLAVNKELVIDYVTKNIYLYVDKQLYNITADISEIVKQVTDNVIANLKENKDLLLDIFNTEIAGIAIGNVKIRLADGSYDTLQNILWNNIADINKIFNTTINGHAIGDGNIEISASDITTGVLSVENGGTGGNTAEAALDNLGAVPITRTINGHTLSSDINLIATDVGSIPYSEKGQPGGVAVLDENGRLPAWSCCCFTVQSTPPDITNIAWIDTSDSNKLKVYDDETSQWVTIFVGGGGGGVAVWG